MSASLRIRVTDRYSGDYRKMDGTPIESANLIIQSVGNARLPTISVHTDKKGYASFSPEELPNGTYFLDIFSKDYITSKVGPAVGKSSKLNRVYYPAYMRFRVTNGRISFVSDASRYLSSQGQTRIASNRWRYQLHSSHRTLTVRLQPAFWKTKNEPKDRPGDSSPNLIVIHRTAGVEATAGPLNHLRRKSGAHYVIGRDGAVVKLIHESKQSFHAGPSRWGGERSVNKFSIGIELVNKSGAFTEAQYEALLPLVDAMIKAYSIPRHRIVGHGDIRISEQSALGGGTKGGKKDGDPGRHFEWHRLEKKGQGLRVTHPDFFDAENAYGGFFDANPKGELKLNDRDGSGRLRDFFGTPVAELQADLKSIGYYVGRDNGRYGNKTHGAVEMFQAHFISKLSKKRFDGKVDIETARLIKGVNSKPAENSYYKDAQFDRLARRAKRAAG